MKNSPLILLLFFVFSIIQTAHAQQCDPIYESIITLKEPRFGDSTVWNTLYKQDGMDKFSDAVQLDAENYLAVGEFTKDEKSTTFYPMLINIDYRGRTDWETRVPTKTQKTIVKVLQTSSGFAVLGDIVSKGQGNGIYLAQYTKDGKYRTQRTFYEPGGNLDAKSMIFSSKKDGFIIAAQYTGEKDMTDAYGILYRLNKNGGQVWKRSYRPGPRTYFYDLDMMSDRTIMIVGGIEANDGRIAGWAVNAFENGAISWQRTYARGSRAEFYTVSEIKGGNYIVSGMAEPIGGGRKSAWVMKIETNGQTVWQRYYTGRYNYVGYDSLTYDDGRSVVLIDGNPLDFESRAHVRLLTLSPRGFLINVESFTEGQNAHAYRVFKGDEGERIIVGHAQTEFSEVRESEDVELYKYDGWMVATQALQKYNDPCAPASFLP